MGGCNVINNFFLFIVFIVWWGCLILEFWVVVRDSILVFIYVYNKLNNILMEFNKICIF